MGIDKMGKEAIAVIGMSGLLPGSENLDKFWENLITNKDLVSQSTRSDFGAPPKVFFNAKKGTLDTCYSLRGGYIRDFEFDPSGYLLDEDILLKQDDQFKWSLHVAREALKNSGYLNRNKEAFEKCGIILGNLSFPTRYSRQVYSPIYAHLAEKIIHSATGKTIKVPAHLTKYPSDIEHTLLSNAPSAFIAQALGLKGTHYSLDAACASSLYAIKLACDELHSGSADMMLAGAVSGADPLFIHIGFSYLHAYAGEDEISAPLDHTSGGLTSSEGAGMVVLKRLSDAQRDGDTIAAVIDAVGLSNDGKGKFLLSPNPTGQKLAFERAYQETSIKPQEIDYLECHATGTALGDTTEFNSIGDFFTKNGEQPPLVGSVKSNMGHLLSAAGMVGMFKVILAMQNDIIPATIKITSPLSSTSGNMSSEQIVQKNQPWQSKGDVSHAGINAFGFGGTNAHMILSSYSEKTLAYLPPEKKKVEQQLAITGMALHFGECKTLDDFYLAIFHGKQFFKELPARRWKGMEQLEKLTAAYQLPTSKELQGAWLSEVDLDLLKFKIQPKEVERLTMQQILMLKVADEAIKDAHLDILEEQGANIAVITAMESELEIHHRMGRWDLSWQLKEAIQASGLDIDKASESSFKNLDDLLKNSILKSYDDHAPSEHIDFIGNIISSRIAALMDFSGPAFTISSNENATYKALEVARNMLSTEEVDAVVLCAIDLSGSLESVLYRHSLHPLNNDTVSMGWNAATSGWMIGEGAGAMILKRSKDAVNDKVYATINDISIVQSDITDIRGAVSAETVEKAAREALKRQKWNAADIGLLEASASGIASEDAAEIEGLTKAYQLEQKQLSCAIGSSKAHIGHTFSASGMTALIRSALCLYHRLIPGIPEWNEPKDREKFKNTPFYAPVTSRPWITEENQTIRKAAVNGIASDGTCAHILLSEGSHPEGEKENIFLQQAGERIIPIAVNTLEDSEQSLLNLDKALAENDYHTVANTYCKLFKATGNYTMVLVASSNTGFLRESTYFRNNLEKAWKNGQPLRTPSGSYFTPEPLGKKGKITLVYPGSGVVYSNVGAGIFQVFPDLYNYMGTKVEDMSKALFSTCLYPRSMEKPTPEQAQEIEKALQSNTLLMMATGCFFSVLYTHVLQTYLEVQADAAIGYSMGETSSMWYANGMWDSHLSEEKFIKAPLFQHKVGGAMDLLGEIWNTSSEKARKKWGCYLVTQSKDMAPFVSMEEWFQTEIAPNTNNTFLTFINTDKEIIISGDNDEIAPFLAKDELNIVKLNINNIVHHPFCEQLSEEFIEMHTLELLKKPPIQFYSSIYLQPLQLNSDAIANNSAAVCFEAVNWPRLIRKMKEENHTIFIEAGANATCSRWINDILQEQDAMAVPINSKGVSDLKGICTMVASLLSHGITIDLNRFYHREEAQEIQKKPVLLGTLRSGGKPFYELVSETNIQLKLIKKQPQLQPALVSSFGGVENDVASFLYDEDMVPEDNITISKFSLTEENMIKTIAVKPKKAENGLLLQNYEDPDRLSGKDIIWNEDDLLTFAKGKISDVFGQEFAIIDTYKRRVMLPMPPYLLVSRVTKLNAKVNEFKPATITTEYDIPYHSDFTTDGQIPWAVAVESGQCDLLLISYLGIDFQNKGAYVYRLLDCTLTFLDDLPFEGQTLRYDIRINSFVQSGDNLLFFFSYECFVEDRMVLKMDGGCAGFFTDEEREKGQGIIYSQKEVEERKNRKKKSFTALLNCTKTSFSKEDLLALTKGDVEACFDENYNTLGRNPSLRLPPEEILMLDSIVSVDRTGGSTGLGYIVAEKDLAPEDWYFPCHFRDDEVLAGSLLAEGGGQLLRFYMLLLGMQRLTKDARFQPVLNMPQKVRCRKEINNEVGTLVFKLDIKEIGLVPEPYVIADLEIVKDGLIAVHFENLGLRLQEKNHPNYLKPKDHLVEGVYVKSVNKPVLLNEYHISQFALGDIVKCFGDEFKIFHGRKFSRQPNTDLHYVSRILDINGQRGTFDNTPAIIAEYDVPEDAWYFVQNASAVMPYAVLMEIALQPCGLLGAYLGSTLEAKDVDLFFRNLDGTGDLIAYPDLRGKTITNKCTLISHTNFGGTILQSYTFEVSLDGAIFYKGTSSFGFFTREDLSSQTGLDNGAAATFWLEENNFVINKGVLNIKLDSLFGKTKLFKSTNTNAPRLHLGNDQLNLLDTATIVKDGGKYGKGYVFATKNVKPYDWFFTCHFYQDPVMPGSLGVEAIIQAIKLYALVQGIGADIKDAHFAQVVSHQTVWKYRGQIKQTDPEMNIELHIKDIRYEDQKITLLGDASLFKRKLRIYEVKDLAVAIV